MGYHADFWKHMGFELVEAGTINTWELLRVQIPRRPFSLIYCADGNRSFARVAVECGYLYGARLPATVNEKVYFADQDWREPKREKYMTALAEHKPAMATVLDWEREEQLPEVLSWAEEAARHVRGVVIIPKVPGLLDAIPERVNGAEVVLG